MKTDSVTCKPAAAWRAGWAMIAAICLFVGCSTKRAAPVDTPRAKIALQTALEGWAKGEPIAKFQGKSAPIVVQDFDWQAGYQLVSFELGSNQAANDANLHCPVTLRLVDPSGKEIEKHVVYLVSTSPVTTVFREVMM